MTFEFFRIEVSSFHEVIERFVSSLYPIDLWEPVKVTVNLHSIPVINLDNWECPICIDEKHLAYRLPCCRKPMCKDCGVSWFENENTSCPFCREDLRDYLGK